MRMVKPLIKEVEKNDNSPNPDPDYYQSMTP